MTTLRVSFLFLGLSAIPAFATSPAITWVPEGLPPPPANGPALTQAPSHDQTRVSLANNSAFPRDGDGQIP